MADIIKLAPKVLKWETGVSSETRIANGTYKPMTLEEQWAVARMRGYSNHPNDSGGATMCGITLATYSKYRKTKGRNAPTLHDLRNITLSEWLYILKVFYWDRMKADQIRNQSIANLCVDNVWVSGTGYIRQIQEVLHVKADGIVGQVTLDAVNSSDQRELFNRLRERRRVFFSNLVVARKSNGDFIKGWLNRLNDYKFED